MQFNRLAGENETATISSFSMLSERGLPGMVEQGCSFCGQARRGDAEAWADKKKQKRGTPRLQPFAEAPRLRNRCYKKLLFLFCSGLLGRRFLRGAFALGAGFFLGRFFRCFLGGFLGWCHRILPFVDLGGAIR